MSEPDVLTPAERRTVTFVRDSLQHVVSHPSYPAMVEIIDRLAAALVLAWEDTADVVFKPRDTYHEDDGAVLWWTLPIQEPPHVAYFADEEFPSHATHWTRLPSNKALERGMAAIDAARAAEEPKA